jgi:hypothetical protein
LTGFRRESPGPTPGSNPCHSLQESYRTGTGLSRPRGAPPASRLGRLGPENHARARRSRSRTDQGHAPPTSRQDITPRPRTRRARARAMGSRGLSQDSP